MVDNSFVHLNLPEYPSDSNRNSKSVLYRVPQYQHWLATGSEVDQKLIPGQGDSAAELLPTRPDILKPEVRRNILLIWVPAFVQISFNEPELLCNILIVVSVS